LPDTAGDLVTTNGDVIGEHGGVHNFTVGQRKGLGVATGSPLYVIQISGAKKQVIVGGEEHLYSRTLRARRVNLISVDDLREPMRVAVKIRHRHEPAPAVIEQVKTERTGDDEILATFDEPQRAITPGQAAVFYDGDVVVGGGLDRVGQGGLLLLIVGASHLANIIPRMASANSSLPLPQIPITTSARPPSFWSRQSGPLKQGIKTGLAGTITYAIYAGWNLPQGYWAVFAALVVTQANLGASWKAALYRTVGSTCGAVSAALLMPILGKGPAGVLIVLFLLATLFGYLTSLHPAFTAAGFTAALILVFGGQAEPWRMGVVSRALHNSGGIYRFRGRRFNLAGSRPGGFAP
jgi:hypothetical protein